MIYACLAEDPKNEKRGGGKWVLQRKVEARKQSSRYGPEPLNLLIVIQPADPISFHKVSQWLLGPATFPLDRLLAILGVLLEENDYETRPHDP